VPDGAGPFAPAAAAFESLSHRCLRALDAGLLSRLARHIDGPLLPGAGVQVMTANPGAWRIEQARSSLWPHTWQQASVWLCASALYTSAS
jgi:hypothetical protein